MEKIPYWFRVGIALLIVGGGGLAGLSLVVLVVSWFTGKPFDPMTVFYVAGVTVLAAIGFVLAVLTPIALLHFLRWLVDVLQLAEDEKTEETAK